MIGKEYQDNVIKFVNNTTKSRKKRLSKILSRIIFVLFIVTSIILIRYIVNLEVSVTLKVIFIPIVEIYTYLAFVAINYIKNYLVYKGKRYDK